MFRIYFSKLHALKLIVTALIFGMVLLNSISKIKGVFFYMIKSIA